MKLTNNVFSLFTVPPNNPALVFKKPPSDDKTDNHDSYGNRNCTPEPLQEDPPSDMRREDMRLKTFVNWPHSFLRPEDLAKNGFYYLGRGDEVRCAFCKVEIMKWIEGDDPASDHQRWAPQCPFLAGPSTVEPVGRDECGVRAQSINMPGPVHPKYASQDARLRTFKDWPRSMRQKPEDLAEAGFFYTGHGDKTKCFYCDGGLKDWEEDDIPWEQHARWFNRCAYVLLVKGKQFVQMVITESCFIEPNEEDTIPQAAKPQDLKLQEPEMEETALDDSKLCKICFSGERNICFVPCGHVVACAKCALASSKCPMCRRTIQCAQRLYYP